MSNFESITNSPKGLAFPKPNIPYRPTAGLVSLFAKTGTIRRKVRVNDQSVRSLPFSYAAVARLPMERNNRQGRPAVGGYGKFSARGFHPGFGGGNHQGGRGRGRGRGWFDGRGGRQDFFQGGRWFGSAGNGHGWNNGFGLNAGPSGGNFAGSHVGFNPNLGFQPFGTASGHGAVAGQEIFKPLAGFPPVGAPVAAGPVAQVGHGPVTDGPTIQGGASTAFPPAGGAAVVGAFPVAGGGVATDAAFPVLGGAGPPAAGTSAGPLLPSGGGATGSASVQATGGSAVSVDAKGQPIGASAKGKDDVIVSAEGAILAGSGAIIALADGKGDSTAGPVASGTGGNVLSLLHGNLHSLEQQGEVNKGKAKVEVKGTLNLDECICQAAPLTLQVQKLSTAQE
ncbi:Os03g0739300 [Oryza sativa Japonica Group]|uniref:Os03g0739300 protein n=1 Tax=Oryza sativa subsp. japonica TaxID=39947 RepID=A0A0P0W3F2_ORYSJ|nr:Os03g0739300 [Oryza sativa Japonica Group]